MDSRAFYKRIVKTMINNRMIGEITGTRGKAALLWSAGTDVVPNVMTPDIWY